MITEVIGYLARTSTAESSPRPSIEMWFLDNISASVNP